MGMFFLWWAKTGHQSQPISPFQSLDLNSFNPRVVVAYAIGPKCEHILLFFTFSELKKLQIQQYETNPLRNQLIFFTFFQTQFFAIFFFFFFCNFQQQNPLKNQYLPHLSSENCEIKTLLLNLTHSFIQPQATGVCVEWVINNPSPLDRLELTT
jgi:hypothetical protein